MYPLPTAACVVYIHKYISPKDASHSKQCRQEFKTLFNTRTKLLELWESSIVTKQSPNGL